MQLNQSKCHLLASGTTEHLWVRVGEEMIWESRNEKLLGVLLDKNLEMYKVKNKLSPIFMQELFTHNPARGKDRFLRPNVKGVTYGDKSLIIFGPKIWNEMLPESLKSNVSAIRLKPIYYQS